MVSACDVVRTCLVVWGDLDILKKRGTWQEAQQSRDSFENDYLQLLQKYDQTGEDRLLMAKLRQVFEEAGQSRLLEEFETASTTAGLEEDPAEEDREGDEEDPEDEPDEGGEEPEEGDEGDEGDEPDEGDGDEEEEEEAGEDDQPDDKAKGKVASEDTDGKVKAAPKGWMLSWALLFHTGCLDWLYLDVHPNSIRV